MRLTFEKTFEKYKAHMIRSNYAKRTIEHKLWILSSFNTCLSEPNLEVYNDLRVVRGNFHWLSAKTITLKELISIY